MATIGIYMMPEHGGHNATFALARRLQSRGHRIQYFAPKFLAEHVARQGFELTQYERVPRPGRSRPPPIPILGLIRRWAMYEEDMAWYFERWLDQCPLDLLLLDPVLWRALEISLRRKIPVLSLNQTLAAPFSLAYPPIHSRLVPHTGSPGTGTRLRHLWAWVAEARPAWLKTVYDRLTAWFGYDAFGRLRRAGGRLRWGDYGYRVDVPELVIAPESLDLDVIRALPDRHYLGTSVDTGRQDGGYDWSWYDPAKPLAYCSLGTLAGNFRPGLRFLSAVIEAFRTRPGWQLIVNCGGWVDRLQREGLPPTLRLEKWVPQLEVLQRARIFLTHGGAGSLREAIFFGVPLLVFPAWGDQFGLSARVVLHKLGLRGDLRAADPREIGSLVDELAKREDIAAAMGRLKQANHEQRELDSGIELIEQFVRERGT